MTSIDSTVPITEILSLLSELYPGFTPDQRGSTEAETVLWNVRTAVLDDILLLLEQRCVTLEEASKIKRFRKQIPARDWRVAETHLADLVSEIRQYKVRGLRDNHTGPVETQGVPIGKH